MAKRVDPLKAKQAKQKKMAIVLAVLFAAVMAYQVPKTLKMLKGPQAAATSAAVAPTPVGEPIGAPVASATAAAEAAGAAGAAVAQPAVLVDSDVPAEAGAGQLRSFELFQTKDPFAQQDGGASTSPDSAPAPSQDPPSSAATKTPSDGAVIAPSPGSSNPAAADPAPAPGGSSTGPAPAAPAGATSISVNGVPADVALEASFPAAAPAFVLVSLAKDGKSVEIGVAGGVYANGAKTIKLTLGKPLTLQNTADGTRYQLELLAVAGFAAPKPGDN